MSTSTFTKLLVPALFLAAAFAGCGDSDNRSAGPGDPLTPPTVTSVTPANGSGPFCPANAIVTAAFSKAMNPATLTTATFTVNAGAGNIAGSVGYVAATNTATFTPTVPLPASSSFTATITTGANDTFGNPLASNFTWTFTTSAACPPPGGVALGAACTFGVVAGQTVTNTGNTTVRGDVALSPGSSAVGWQDAPANTYAPTGTGTHTAGPGLVTGTIHLTDAPPAPNNAADAQAAVLTAYNDLAGRSAPAPTVIAGDIGGLTLAPGIYKSTSTLGITGTVTLDGGTTVNPVWIFQIATGLTTMSSSNVVLAGTANAHNIFWQVGSSATLGTNSTFNGSILTGSGSITLATGATLNGRALAQTAGSVTLDTNMVNVPACP